MMFNATKLEVVAYNNYNNYNSKDTLVLKPFSVLTDLLCYEQAKVM